MMNKDEFDERFARALSAAPEAPDCYWEISRRVKRKDRIAKTAWAMAASLAISAASLLFIGGNDRRSTAPDVAEELQSIYNHVSGDDIHAELISCSIVREDNY